jgi:hypothetical protein
MLRPRTCLLLAAFATLGLTLTAASCSGSSSDDGGAGAGGASAGSGGDTGTGGDPGTGGGAGGNAGGNAGSAAGGASGAAGDGGQGGGVPLNTGGTSSTLIYAHTDTTLFQLDPTSADLALTKVGDFDCVPSNTTAMTDVAVNSKGELWSVSAHAIWPLTVANGVVHCGNEIQLANHDVRFYALTFAPAGVFSPDKEVLVAGNTAGELWEVSEQGQLTQRGSFGPVPADDGNGHPFPDAGKAWELSGDIVFLANKGNPVGFATVRDCPSPPDTTNCNFTNTLIEIDIPKMMTATTESVTKAVRGQLVTGPQCKDGKNGFYGNMYGIAAWNDKVYGFSRSGNLVEISVQDGTACLVHAYDKALYGFAGAGVSTLAPIVVPDPK